MALPVLLIGAAVVLVAGGAAAAWNRDQIVLAWKGKRVAVFGESEVGKTQLVRFLSTGTIPIRYKQDVVSRRTPSRRFKLRDLGINVKESVDVPGFQEAYGDWKKLHQKSDVVIYLLRVDRVMAGDRRVAKRVSEDLRFVGEWQEARKDPPHLFLVGTYCDLDEEYRKTSPESRGKFMKRFLEHPVMTRAIRSVGGRQKVKVLIGSTKSRKDVEEIVCEIFRQVSL